jgi:lipoxygenase
MSQQPHLKPSSTSHTTTSILSASCTARARSTRALFSPRAAASSSSCSFSSPSSYHSSLLSLGRPPRPVHARRGDTAIGCVPSSTVPSSSGAAADPSADMAKSVRVTATATIEVTVGGFLNSLRPSRAIDEIRDFVGRSLYLELVSSELDASKQLALHHLAPTR